jgi:serine/threonine protein kinase
MYLLLSRVLPFDDEDDREIARQTIYDPPDFSFHPWEKVSKEAKDICKSKSPSFIIYLILIGLLEKNRSKRPSLEEVLNHPWFSDFKDIHQIRLNTNNDSKFKAYTLTEPNSPKIKEEIEKYSQE